MRKPSKNIVLFLPLTTIALNVMAAWGRARFGSLKAALLYTGGVRVLVDPGTRSVGDLHPQAQTSVKFALRNWSDRAMTVHGSKASCTCLVVDDLPKTIPAGGRGVIEVAFRAGTLPGEVKQSVVLLTDAAT